ncbi:molybdate ABC transporter substrate-binding protein [Colwellia piezophila]|uniref:molybdate ABC transporter substrate-binding protein n=1 Tax=Colwellia piezophila TaxID=211668 RepID=UPI0003626A62|nr:molybdate ABC transporter substrate-binding protein [Colwellia piezophila]
MLRFLLVAAFAISFLCVTSSQAQQNNADDSDTDDNNTPLRIAVAANFTPVLKILLKDFSKQTGIKSQIISGASGAMFLQIKHGAPYDIFLSADSRRPKELEQDGFSLRNSRKTYAIGQLALYCSDANSLAPLTLEQLPTILLKNPRQRFAIANPDIAPYGKAAKEALSHMGLWQAYQPRLITGINIGQTFAQIRSKAVSMGIVANSQLVLNNLSGVIIPTSYHQAIEQQFIIVSASKKQIAAKKLSEFLLSPKSQKTIVSYGYAPITLTNNSELITK